MQMDGFDQTVNVKVIMATNRADTLDPALIRPGRLDRKIEFPLPDRRQKRLVFQVMLEDLSLHLQELSWIPVVEHVVNRNSNSYAGLHRQNELRRGGGFGRLRVSSR